MVRAVAFKAKIKNHLKFVLVIGLLLLIICIVVAGVLIHANHNNVSNKANIAQSLKNAKKALSADPNNVDKTLTVAYLTKTENPTAAKQYFTQALDKFKQQNNPDVPGKSAATYWAAAGLAQQAGEISQAKKYYQETIQAAKPSDSYDQGIAKQSQAELKELQ